MKRFPVLIVARLAVLAIVMARGAAFAQLTSDNLTYQGQLVLDGTPVNQAMNFEFALYDAATGGTLLTAQSVPGVAVSEGLFTVELSTLAVHITSANDRWLEIRVKKPADALYTTLPPRQPLTAAAFSIFAKKAASAVSVTGTVPGSQITGTVNASVLGSGSVNGTVNFAPPAGAPFLVSSTQQVANLNSDLLDGLDSTAFVKRTGDTMSGALNVVGAAAVLDFGSTKRQHINLWNNGEYGIGMQDFTFYQRSNSAFAWYKGGIHSNGAYDAGSGGNIMMRLDGNGEFHVGGGVFAGVSVQSRDAAGYVGTPANGERWVAYSSGTPGLFRVWSGGDKMTIDTTGKLTCSSLNTGGSAIAATLSGTARGVEASAPGAGIAVRGVNGAGAGGTVRSGVYGESTESGGNGVVGVANNGTGAYAIWGRSTSGYAGKFEGKVDIEGVASVEVLTITGGSDVAEPFQVTPAGDTIPAGAVLVIDPDHPGQLKLSDRAYDKKVAGIVSGANGVNAGLTLRQKDVLEGTHNVALSGRVYVMADADGAPIEPGDLMTTSSTPGHAMRVSDASAAQGAILGKAMTRLGHGTGFVLVLVTLQ